MVYFSEFIFETAVDILDEFVIEYQQLISGWIYAANTPGARDMLHFQPLFFCYLKMNNFKDQSHTLVPC